MISGENYRQELVRTNEILRLKSNCRTKQASLGEEPNEQIIKKAPTSYKDKVKAYFEPTMNRSMNRSGSVCFYTKFDSFVCFCFM